MKFEFVPNKSMLNKEKHGIDFYEAQSLWLDPCKVEIEARTTDEIRKLLIATFDGSVWSAVFTIRLEAVRIISVRKSRKNEKEIYYSREI